MKSMKFQIIDWNQYHECDNDEDDNSSEENKQNKNKNVNLKYKIRLFGRTEENKSIYVNVINYTPFFYIKIPNEWTLTKIMTLINLLKSKIANPNLRKGLINFDVVDRKDLYGFTGYKDFKFVRLIFDNMKSFKSYEYFIIRNKIKFPSLFKNPVKLKIYESNIEPFIRCMHIRKLNACGWVEINEYKKLDKTKSYCNISIETDWKNLNFYDSNSIQKFIVAVFDIECMSESGNFPQAYNDNDQVIQIGTVFSYYGESEPFYKNIITLKGCNKIKGLEDVDIECYNDERSELLAWTNLIQKYNPDFISGWNINGFDFQYIHDRAKKLNILTSFSKLSKIKNEISEFKEKTLSSSALGDNLLKYFEMNGRIIIDLMKVQQRDAKLDSYKLDFVASTYIREKIFCYDIIDDKSIIYTSSIYGIKDDDFINISWNDGLSDNKHDKKYKILKIKKLDENEINLINEEYKSYKNYDKFIFKIPKIVYMITINGIIPDEIFTEANEGLWHLLTNKKYIIASSNKNNNEEINDPNCKWIDLKLQDTDKPIKGNIVFWAHTKDDISPKDLFRLYKGSDDDRGIIAKYCIMDCILVTKLLEKLQVLNNNIAMANVCSVPVSYIFMRGQGVKIFSLVSKKCRDLGFLIPKLIVKNQNNDKNDQNKFKKIKFYKDDSDTEDENKDNAGYEGATVFPPKKGVYYEPIPVLDYASLYPRSMICYNISHECFVNDSNYDNLPGYTYETITYNNNDGTTTTCRFSKKKDGTKGVLPLILEELLDKRSSTKQLMNKTDDIFLKNIYDGLQLAYKITANSLYGQVGAPTSPIYMKELAASTTATGRKMLELARDFIQGPLDDLINLALHDKQKFIETAKGLFKDSPDSKFIEPKFNRNNMDDFINYFYDKINILLSDKYKVKPKVIYGDSVVHDTPILLKNNKNEIEIKTIENIGNKWSEYNIFKNNIEGLSDKQHDENIDYKVWTDKGWADIKRVIKHKTNKKIYEILTHTGCVRVTSDHSLLDIKGNQLKPNECKIGTELLHNTLIIENKKLDFKINQNELDKSYIYGFFFGDGSCGKYGEKIKTKYSWALNNKDMELNKKLIKKLNNIYPDDNFKILNTIKSSNVYKIVPSCGNIKKFVIEYRDKFYDKDKHKIIPNEILNGTKEQKENFLEGYYAADGCRCDTEKSNCHRFDVKGQISALNLYQLVTSLNYKVSINKRKDKPEIFRLTYSSNNNKFRKNPNKIKKITELGITDNYVYDLETNIGHFHAGVGSMIVKNTDSVFFTPKIHDIVTKEIKTNRAALRVSIEIGILAGQTIAKILPDPEDLEYEKTFWPFIILTKKRYVGNLFEEDDSNYQQKSMGIVLKRRDNAKIVKIVVGGIVDYILNGKDDNITVDDRNKGAINYTRTLIKQILKGQYSIDKFIVSKTLRGNYVDRTRIAHAYLADKIGLRDPGNKPSINDRIPYVYIVSKDKVKLQGERIEDPKYVIDNSLELDYLFYITNQIMKPSIQFLELIAENPSSLFENYINKEINRRKKKQSIYNYIINESEDEKDDINNEFDQDSNINQKDNSKKIKKNKNTKNNDEDRIINTIKKNKNSKSLTILL
jgi:DNA polymerase elongation subunit (family B)